MHFDTHSDRLFNNLCYSWKWLVLQLGLGLGFELGLSLGLDYRNVFLQVEFRICEFIIVG